MAARDEFGEAKVRAGERRARAPRALEAHYDRRLRRVVVRLSTGLDVAFSPHDAQGLKMAKPGDLAVIEISPSGFGLHFPRLDADLYLPALLEGWFGSRAWTVAKLGRRNGQTRKVG